MKNGLKKRLNDEIKRIKYMSLEEVHQLAKYYNHKESYAERVLRPSDSPEIKTIRNKKGHNTGYKWIGMVNDELKGIDSNAVIETKSIYPSKNNDKKEDFRPTKENLLKYE